MSSASGPLIGGNKQPVIKLIQSYVNEDFNNATCIIHLHYHYQCDQRSQLAHYKLPWEERRMTV